LGTYRWNVLDFVVVTMSLVALGPINAPVSIIRVTRAFRAVRFLTIFLRAVRYCAITNPRGEINVHRFEGPGVRYSAIRNPNPFGATNTTEC
jgi:hypothetical protein